MGGSVTRLTSGPQSHLTRLRAGYLASGIRKRSPPWKNVLARLATSTAAIWA